MAICWSKPWPLSGTNLTIKPDVQVRFVAGVSVLVEGTLSAIGTPDQPYSLTSSLAELAPGNWSGLYFAAGSSGSQLSFEIRVALHRCWTSEGAPSTGVEGIARPQGEGVDIGAHKLWYQRVYLPLALRQ